MFVFFWFSVLVRFVVVVVVVVAIGGVEEFVASVVVVVVVVQEELVAGVKGKTEEIFVRLFFFFGSMAAETAGGAFHEGAGDGGDLGKQQQVLVPEEIRRNGVHADAGIGDGGESLDFSHPLREGLEEEEEEEEKHSQGGGGGGAAAAAADDDDHHHAKANGDHHLAAQDGEALEVSEDRVASFVDEVREEDEEGGGGGGGGGEDSSVQAARQGSEAVEQEEEAAAPPKLAVQTSPPEGLLQSHDEVPQPQHQQASEGELLPNASEGAETISDSKAAAEEYPQRDLALLSTAAARSVEFPQTSEEDEEEKISSSRSKPQAGTVQAVESATRLEKVDPEEEEEAAAAVELSSSSAALPLPNAGMSNPFNHRTGTAPHSIYFLTIQTHHNARVSLPSCISHCIPCNHTPVRLSVRLL